MDFLIIIAVLIISVVIHELAHGYSALALGDRTAQMAGRLTLNPIKHLDLVGSFIVPFILFVLPTSFVLGWAKPVPYNPYNLRNQKWGEAMVAAAGPATNFLLALIFGLVIRFAGDLLPSDVLALMGLIVLVNVVLGLFNLIPIPPLDGSKILFSVLPLSFTMSNTRMVMERFGLLIVLGALFLFGWIIFPVLQVAIFYSFSLFAGDLEVLNLALTQFFP